VVEVAATSLNAAVRSLYPYGPGSITVHHEAEGVRQLLSELLRTDSVANNLLAVNSDFRASLNGNRMPMELNLTAIVDQVWHLPLDGPPYDLNYQLELDAAADSAGLVPGTQLRLRGKIRDVRRISPGGFTLDYDGRTLARIVIPQDSVIARNRKWATTPWIFVLGKVSRLRPLQVLAVSVTLEPESRVVRN